MGIINSAKIAWKKDGVIRLEDELDYFKSLLREKGGKSEELEISIDRLSNLVEKAKEELEELENWFLITITTMTTIHC